jgi:hypothetical protein
MLNSEKAAKIINNQIPMDKAVIERVKQALAKKGVIVERTAEWDEYLIFTGKEAAVFSDNLIVMHTNVSASGFFEELIHLGQIRSGRVIRGDDINNILMEIEAQERLIKYKRAYKITDYEIGILEENLENYIMMLKKLKGGE